MHPAAIVILVLSNSGFWLSGTDSSVSASWVAPEHTPRATLVWDLYLGSIKLDGASVAMKNGELSTDFKIRCPNVRVRTTLDFRYRIIANDGKQLFAGDSAIIQAFPSTLTDGWSSQWKNKNIVVIDAADGLPALLHKAHVQFDRLDDPQSLAMLRPDVVLINADRVSDSPLAQACMIHLAQVGSRVMILKRGASGNAIREEKQANLHSLNWQAADLTTPSTLTDSADELLTSSQTTGENKILSCTCDFGPWQADPRAIKLIGNAVNYLLTPLRAPLSVIQMHNSPAGSSRRLVVETPACDNS